MEDSHRVQFELALARTIEVFPELKEAFEKELEWWDGEFPGPHNVMGDIFDPYVIDMLMKSDPPEKLEVVFQFIEELVMSDYEYISNVGVVTVCEDIVCAGPKIYRKALRYAHERTRYHMKLLIEFFYPEENAIKLSEKHFGRGDGAGRLN